MMMIATGVPLKDDLESPLLEMEVSCEGEDDDYPQEGPTKCPEAPQQDIQERSSRLYVLSFGTGLFIGLIAQVILEMTMWDTTILNKPTRELVLFTVAWSILTCAMVHCSMLLYMRDMQASFCPQDWLNATWKQVSNAMEVCIVGGALLSISGFWFVLDLSRILLPLPSSAVVSIMISASTLYILFFALVMPTTGKNSSSSSSSSSKGGSCRILSASLLGIATGFGSQIGICMILWKGYLPENITSHWIYFSFVWSACTVLIAFVGCMTLTCFKGAAGSDEARTHLRMESFYVLCSLLGISAAWLTMDTLIGFSNQVLPSLCMLVVSLFIFRTIVYYFPEDKCLEDVVNKQEQQSTITEEAIE